MIRGVVRNDSWTLGLDNKLGLSYVEARDVDKRQITALVFCLLMESN